MFTDYENTVVRVAKAWDSPHAGTVPVLLEKSLKLAAFGTHIKVYVPKFSFYNYLNIDRYLAYKVQLPAPPDILTAHRSTLST